MVNKLALIISVMLTAIFLASTYGFLHNQISYLISEQYFTKLKFSQLWSMDYLLEHPRLGAGLIGIISTWWFGMLSGLISGIIASSQSQFRAAWKSAIDAIIRILGITAIGSLIGILVGTFIVSQLNVNWHLPVGITEERRFLIAGTMHTFSYIGGVIGLIYGIKFQVQLSNADFQSTSSSTKKKC